MAAGGSGWSSERARKETSGWKLRRASGRAAGVETKNSSRVCPVSAQRDRNVASVSVKPFSARRTRRTAVPMRDTLYRLQNTRGARKREGDDHQTAMQIGVLQRRDTECWRVSDSCQ